MNVLSLDFETFSGENIKKAGLYKYVQAPSFHILLTAYSINHGPVKQIDHTAGEAFPEEFMHALFDPGTIKQAWNATFEWYVLAKVLNLHNPLDWLPQWRDTMVQALYCGFPPSLDAAGDAMGLPEDKKKLAAGRTLIQYFCKPHETEAGTIVHEPCLNPERWELFKTYNRGDVTTEQTIADRLSRFPVPPSEWAIWRLDQKINAYGVYIDKDLIDGAQALSDVGTQETMQEAQEFSGLSNPRSVQQLLPWINARLETPVKDLRKATVTDLLAGGKCSPEVETMLSLRQALGKTSVKKYSAMSNALCADGRVRGLLQFYGANRTGRWAGRLVQVQNLPQNHIPAIAYARKLVKEKDARAIKFVYGSVPNTLSQLIRTAFIPSPGRTFAVADFSAIEARVIAWFAGEEWRMQVFRNGGKIYETSAAQMFHVPVETIHKGDPLRQRGKIAELALGYQGSVNALKSMDKTHALKDDELPEIVRRWREASPHIVRFWYAVQRAALDTIQTGRQNVVRGVGFAREIDPENKLDFMTIQLPSGRKLYYDHPTVSLDEKGRSRIRYNGLEQKKHKWLSLDTYGGKLVENIVQATARDCLALTMQRLDARGFPIVFHIHDEVIADVPAGRKDALKEMYDVMKIPIPWARGLILCGDGFTSDFYMKD